MLWAKVAGGLEEESNCQSEPLRLVEEVDIVAADEALLLAVTVATDEVDLWELMESMLPLLLMPEDEPPPPKTFAILSFQLLLFTRVGASMRSSKCVYQPDREKISMKWDKVGMIESQATSAPGHTHGPALYRLD